MEKNYLSIKKENLNLNERKALSVISSKKTTSLKALQKIFGGYAISANVLLNFPWYNVQSLHQLVKPCDTFQLYSFVALNIDHKTS